jgi:hypothetical protein
MAQKDCQVEELMTSPDLNNIELAGQRQKRAWQTPKLLKANFQITANLFSGTGTDSVRYSSPT